jgi:hypothetical protein
MNLSLKSACKQTDLPARLLARFLLRKIVLGGVGCEGIHLRESEQGRRRKRIIRESIARVSEVLSTTRLHDRRGVHRKRISVRAVEPTQSLQRDD